MRAMRIGAIICLAALCVRARAADTLEEIRTQMLANLERLPNYTCVETVERTRQRAGLTRRDIPRIFSSWTTESHSRKQKTE